MSVALADVVDQLSALPPFPKITARLLALLNNSEVTVDEFTNVISADPAMTMKMIHLANSPFYMVSKPIESVRQAIVVLGLNTIKTISTAAALQKGIAAFRPRADIFDFIKFWEHSYATAIAIRYIAKARGYQEKDKLYLSGLIHDVGKIILAYHWPESWKQISLRITNTGESFDDIELQLFSLRHTALAATLCRNWQFPEDIVQMIEHHHNPEEASDEYKDRCKLLHFADYIAAEKGFEFPDGKSECLYPEVSELMNAVGSLKSEVDYQLKSLGG